MILGSSLQPPHLDSGESSRTCLHRILPFLSALLLISSLHAPLSGQNREGQLLFEQASQHYLQGEFEEAARLYEQILLQGWESGELYYNLGNTYYRKDNIGAAILNYERARRFLPGDADLHRNLELANLRVVDKIEPLPEFLPLRLGKNLLQMLSLRVWLWLGLLCYWITALHLACWFVFRRSQFQRWLFRGALVLGAGTILSFAFFAGSYWLERSEVPAVIMVSEALARSAPGAGASEVFRVHEGTRVQTGTRSQDWTEIILADGKVGWVPSETLEII